MQACLDNINPFAQVHIDRPYPNTSVPLSFVRSVGNVQTHSQTDRRKCAVPLLYVTIYTSNAVTIIHHDHVVAEDIDNEMLLPGADATAKQGKHWSRDRDDTVAMPLHV